MNNNKYFNIVVANWKGGTGKTTVASTVAKYFDAVIIDLDNYSVLEETLVDENNNDRVFKLALDEPLPTVENTNVVYDTGGFDDKRLYDILKIADLIIMPFSATINSMGTTLNCYNELKKYSVPILMVVNAVVKDSDAFEAMNYLQEYTRDEIPYAIVPFSRAIQTAENKGISAIELYNTSTGLGKHTYKKICNTMLELMKIIKEYI